jgi:chaperonin cofactor prefoldin
VNPQFMKGYYRLATAQLELGDYDMAQATIKQGLALDANNSQLLKVLRTIKQSKKAATTTGSTSASASAQQRKVDAASSKELYDLQIQNSQTTREYQTVQANLTKAQREQRINQVTLDELDTSPEANGYYRSMGKIFVKSTRDRVTDHLRSSIQEQSKKESDLSQKMDYLERRIKSQQQNMDELLSGGD